MQWLDLHFPDVAGYIRYETFVLCHFTMCFWDRFCVSRNRKAGQGEVGWCIRRLQTAWLSLGSALETPWLALGGPFLSSYAQRGLETSHPTLLDPHSLVWTSGCQPRVMTIARLLRGGCGLSYKHVEDGCEDSCMKFEGWKPNTSGDMYGKINACVG